MPITAKDILLGDNGYLPLLNDEKLLNSQIYDNGTFIGINTILPTAKLDINSNTSDNTEYALNIYNSLNEPLFKLRNDGSLFLEKVLSITISSGTSSLLALDSNGKLFNTGLDYTTIGATPSVGINQIAFGDSLTGTLTSDSLFVRDNTTGNIGIGTTTPVGKLHIYVSATNYAVFGDNSPRIFKDIDNYLMLNTDNLGVSNLAGSTSARLVSGGVFQVHSSNGAGYLISNNFSDYMFRSYNDSGVNKFVVNHGGYYGNNRLGVGVDPTATVHVKSLDATSSNYALKVDDSSNTHLLYVRNDGVIDFGDSSQLYNQWLQYNAGTLKINRNTTSNFYYNGSELILTGINGNSGSDLQITSIAVKNQILLRGSNNKRLSFSSNGGDANMQLSSNGDLYIGADSINGVDASARLHVVGIDDLSSTSLVKLTGNSGVNGMFMYNNGRTNWYVGGAIAMGLDNGSNLTSYNYTYFKNGVTFGNIAVTDNTIKVQNTWNVGFGSINSGSMLNVDGTNFTNAISTIGLTQLKGIDSTTLNYTLKVNNSNDVSLLEVRNDGYIYALPTYGTTASTGTASVLGIDSTGKLFNTGLDYTTLGASSISGLTTNYLTKATSASTIGDSVVYESGGNVGIGTSDPTEKLNVSGRVRINTAETDYAYSIWDNSNNIKTQIGYNANGSLIQTYNGILMLNPTGLSVGIGSGIATNAKLSFGNYYVSTSSPTSEQQTSHIKLYDGGVGGSFYGFGISSGIKDFLNIAANGGNANIAFYTNSTQKAVITTDGNVGIGTSSPSSKLHLISGTSLISNFVFRVDAQAGIVPYALAVSDESEVTVNTQPVANIILGQTNNIFTTHQTGYYFQHNAALLSFGNSTYKQILGLSSVLGTYTGNFSYHDFIFRTNNLDRAVLTKDGDFSIGTITPSINTRLYVKGQDATSSNYAFKADNSAGSPLLYVRNDGATIIGNSNMLFYQDKIGVGDFSLQSNLSIVNGNDVQYPIKVTSSNATLTRNVLTNNGAVTTDIQIGNSNGSFYFGVEGSAVGYLDNYTGQSFLFKKNGVAHSVINSSNNWGIGTSSPTAKLQVVGSSGYNQFRMETSYTPTSSADTNGNVGDMAWDDNYIYIKTSTGWKRSGLSTF